MLTLLNCNNNFAFRSGIALFCCALSGAKAQNEPADAGEGIDLLYGHYELQMDYTEAEGFDIGISYNLSNDFNDSGAVRRLPAATSRVLAPPVAKRTVTQATSFLGTPGEPLWVLAQAFEVGNQFLGMRVLGERTIFQSRPSGTYVNRPPGSIGLRVLSVTGSGPDRGGSFGLWESAGLAGLQVYFNSSDGLDANDDLPFLPIGAHSHFSWGFTQEGTYDVEFETYGRLLDGTDVSDTNVITFVVPHSGVVTELEGKVCREGERWELAVGDSERGVVYGERRVFLQPESEDETGVWSCPFTLSADAWTVPDVAGLPVAVAQNGAGDDFSGGVRLCLVEHVGPGLVSAVSDGGTVVFDSTDGIDSSDCVDLASGSVTGTLSFSTGGIHWLGFRAEGLAGGAVADSSELLWLRCGAGLEPDHDYASWADSFERALGLATGALSDQGADFDNDGLSNLMEYLQEAAGAHPAVRDCAGELIMDSDAVQSRYVFMRDLYKDPLDLSTPKLVAGASEDFERFTEASAIRVGFPLVMDENFSEVDGLDRRQFIFETGHEEGNARSLFMMRALQSPRPESGRDFFRLTAE